MIDTICIRIRIRAEIWKQMQYQWYPSVSDSFPSLPSTGHQYGRQYVVPIWVSRFEKEINLLVTHDLDIIEFELENFAWT